MGESRDVIQNKTFSLLLFLHMKGVPENHAKKEFAYGKVILNKQKTSATACSTQPSECKSEQ